MFAKVWENSENNTKKNLFQLLLNVPLYWFIKQANFHREINLIVRRRCWAIKCSLFQKLPNEATNRNLNASPSFLSFSFKGNKHKQWKWKKKGNKEEKLFAKKILFGTCWTLAVRKRVVKWMEKNVLKGISCRKSRGAEGEKKKNEH